MQICKVMYFSKFLKWGYNIEFNLVCNKVFLLFLKFFKSSTVIQALSRKNSFIYFIEVFQKRDSKAVSSKTPSRRLQWILSTNKVLRLSPH